jgi:hypothetical protein
MLGVPAAESYEQLVTSKQRIPDNPDDPTVCGGPSMVNVFYLTARGKYIMACKFLIPPAGSELRDDTNES